MRRFLKRKSFQETNKKNKQTINKKIGRGSDQWSAIKIPIWSADQGLPVARKANFWHISIISSTSSGSNNPPPLSSSPTGPSRQISFSKPQGWMQPQSSSSSSSCSCLLFSSPSSLLLESDVHGSAADVVGCCPSVDVEGCCCCGFCSTAAGVCDVLW